MQIGHLVFEKTGQLRGMAVYPRAVLAGSTGNDLIHIVFENIKLAFRLTGKKTKKNC